MTKPSSSGRKNKPVTISISPTSLAPATQGIAYTQTITASGGTGPYNFTVSSPTTLPAGTSALPSGLTFSLSGVLSGTPTVSGSFSLVIQATDSMGHSGSKSYTLNISTVTISISPTSLTAGVTGIGYSQTLTATGGVAPYAFVATTALPTGLSLNSGGILSGTPTIAGSSSFTVKATDSRGYSGTASCSLTIAVPAPPPPAPPPSTAGAYGGGSTIDLTGFTQKWLKRDFHAIGDGLTDDYTAIQNWLNAAGAGIALKAEAGTFAYSRHLLCQNKSNFKFIGANPATTVFLPTAGVLSDHTADTAIVFYQCSNFEIWDFGMYAPNATSRAYNGANGRLVYMDSCSSVKARNLILKKSPSASILCSQGHDYDFGYFTMQDGLADGCHFTGGVYNSKATFAKGTNLGDDCFASIGYANSGQNSNIEFSDNESDDCWWGNGVDFQGTTTGRAYRNKINRSGVAGLAAIAEGSYATGPTGGIDFQNNILTGCVTRTDTGHGSIMLYVSEASGYVHNVTSSGDQIINPTSGPGVRAFGYSSTANVTASISNIAMTGVSKPYSIESYATVSHP